MTQKDKKTSQNNKKQSVIRNDAQRKVAEKSPMSNDEMRKAKNAERSMKRRRKKIIMFSLGIVLLVAIGIILMLTVFFKIETIAVSGDEIYNNETVTKASGLNTGDILFLFDKDKVSEKIETELPYVENAAIKRSLNGTVTIKITAAEAAMALDMGDSFVLMSASGKVLENEVAAINDNVSVINASKVVNASPGSVVEFENENDIKIATEVKKLVTTYELGNINIIDVTDYSDIKLQYDNRITLETGVEASLSAKMDFIKATLTKLNQDKPSFTGTIDFTIDNKAYINTDDTSGGIISQVVTQAA